MNEHHPGVVNNEDEVNDDEMFWYIYKIHSS